MSETKGRFGIRFRILAAIFVFEVIGYSAVTVHNKNGTEEALLQVRHRQLEETFKANTAQLNNLTDYMESVARGLATAGSRLQHIKASGVDVVPEVQSYIVKSVEQMPDAIGGGLWFEPNVFNPADRYFGPYASWNKGKVEFTWDLNTPKYDYLNQSWYTVAIANGAAKTLHPKKGAVWTEPYKDEAGTSALMITVDHYMYDDAGTVIGLSTVDWSLEQIQRFVREVTLTDNTAGFLVDSRSGLVIADGKNPAVQMTPANKQEWMKGIALGGTANQVQVMPSVGVDGVDHIVRYATTNSGLVFGMRVPLNEFSAEANAIAAAGSRVSFGVALFFISLGALVLHLLFQPFKKVIALIGAATSKRDARGELIVEPLVYNEQNEFQGVVGALNQMTAAIVERDQRLAAYAEGLEHQVAERTSQLQKRTVEIEARNTQMRLVMNNVNQGLLTIDELGTVANERSAMVERWLGKIPGGASLSEILRPLNPGAAEWLDMGLPDLFAEDMPAEVIVAQLPHHLQVEVDGARQDLRIDYTPIRGDNERIERVLVLFSDETSAREAARREAEEKENMAVFERIMRDRSGFVAFYDDANKLMASLTGQQGREEERRTLHTLKGNFGIFGLTRLASVIHDLETAVAEEDRLTNDLERATLVGLWRDLSRRMQNWLGDQERNFVEVEDAEYQAVLAALFAGGSAADIAPRVQAWSLEPAARRLVRLAEQAQAVAVRLERSPVSVDVVSNGVRLDPVVFNAFWSSLVHVTRNAIDHGIEPAEAREAAGKPTSGQLRFCSEFDGSTVTVTVDDDGRGIDWDRVAAKAQSAGLPHDTRSDLVAALFTDGLSTRDEVSELSGRGVGMSAVKAAVDELGGAIEVESRPNRGTRFVFSFALSSPALAPARARASGGRLAFVMTPQRTAAA
jgi:signal transduction histidine kinase